MRILPLLLCILVTGSAVAQRPALVPGSRVRIRAQGLGERPVVATIIIAEGDTLVVKPDSEAAGLIVPWETVSQLDVGSWRSHVIEGAAVGLLGGLLVAAVAQPCDYDDCSLEEDLLGLAYQLMPEPETRFTALGILGLFAGAVVGHAAKTETWRPVMRPDPKGGGSMALGFAFSF